MATNTQIKGKLIAVIGDEVMNVKHKTKTDLLDLKYNISHLRILVLVFLCLVQVN